MQYGCIGEHLKHSFSKEIHNSLADYDYEIREIPREGVPEFMKKRDFTAINVTIPYKEEVLPYMYYLDTVAREIGAVNTVVKRDGLLYGYNTDFYGMSELFRHAGVTADGKKCAILGTGGTAKTARAVARALGAREIITVSRREGRGVVSYSELYESHSDTEVIINTTPVGMYPNIFDSPVELSRFPRLSGVIDAVYNPLCTPLILEAKRLGVPAEGGLYMLVMQAVRASEFFLDTKYDASVGDAIFGKIRQEKENIVLIGMPASGKSTVGRILSERLQKKLIDTDELIVEREGKSIPEIFETVGEAGFRDIESSVIRDIASVNDAVISTGGGAVLRDENVKALKENGRLYFIDRPLSALIPTSDRPTASTREAIEKRYHERYGIYKASCDVHIDANRDADGVADEIERNFRK